MADLQRFTLTQMIELGSTLRSLGKEAESMEAVANRIVRYLYRYFEAEQGGGQACALIRLFKTHAFGELDAGLRQFAGGMLGGTAPSPALKCLVLLATAGEREEWNFRAGSRGHQAIPLPNQNAIDGSPMIARLVSQLGVSANVLLDPDPELMLDLQQSTFNVFHVPEAEGSPYVPAQQEFVVPCNIKSVLGFGGLLPPGELFALILFSRVPIPRQTANLFQPLALSAKLALLPYTDRVFDRLERR